MSRSKKGEILLTLIVVTTLYVFVFKYVTYFSHGIALLVSLVFGLFCVHFLIGIGRKRYSRVYLLTGFVALASLVIAMSGYVLDMLGETCMGIGGVASSCAQSFELTSWLLIFYTAVPLALLAVVAMIFQLGVAKRNRKILKAQG